MDIRMENTQNTLYPMQERIKQEKKKKPLLKETEFQEEDRNEIKTDRETTPEPVVISKEELQDFMLLLTTSKSSPRLFDRYIDEKRKDRIDALLNSQG